MKALLTLPGDVLKENLSGFKETLNLYSARKWEELDNVYVTKDFAGNIASRFGDEEWILSAYIDSKITNKCKIIFSDISSHKLCNEMKLLCYLWIYIVGSYRRNQPIKPSTLVARHSKLTQIYKYLDNMKLESVASLSHPILFFEFCNYVQSLKYSTENNKHIFGVLGLIQNAGDELPLKFKFPVEQSITQLAREYACSQKQSTNQFYAIPTKLMEKIYSHAIGIVQRLHPHKELLHNVLSDLKKNYDLGRKLVDDKIETGRWKWLTKDSENYRVEVNKHKPSTYSDIIEAHLLNTDLQEYITKNIRYFEGWITNVQTACYVVCGAFTGMRKSELFCLHADSFKKREIGGRTFYSLQSFHHKMVQGTGQKKEWVTVPICKDAIELAEALVRHLQYQLMSSEDPMHNHIASCLWLNQAQKSKPPTVRYEGNLRTHFEKITNAAGANISEEDITEFKLINPNCNPQQADKKIVVGKPWPITTHQFRRTFAVFAKRYDLCSNVAIKDQFKHLDVPTTEWYEEGGITAKLRNIELDFELKESIARAKDELTTEIIHRWYNSKENLYGKRGLAIQKDRKGIAQKYKSWDVIFEHVKAGRLTLVGTLHSYCLAGYECQMHKVTSPANCFKCENQLIDETKAKNWVERHKWVTEQVIYLDSLNRLTPSTYSHYIVQIRAAEKVMHHFRIPFSEFEIESEEYEQIPIDES